MRMRFAWRGRQDTALSWIRTFLDLDTPRGPDWREVQDERPLMQGWYTEEFDHALLDRYVDDLFSGFHSNTTQHG